MNIRPELLPALAAFEAAARHQNFAHAAEELHLTASAISHHVRRLESRLGISLFRRHARGVILTAQGRMLADATGSALADLESTLRSLRDGRDEHVRVRITTLHSLLNAWLLPRLAEFSTRHPQVRLEFDNSIALTRFDDSGPDLGIRYGPGHWPGLSAHLMMGDELIPAAAPQFVKRAKTPDAIAGLPLVSDLARQGWPDWFRAAGVHGAQPNIRHTFSDSTDALEASARGLGAVLARTKIVMPWLAAGRLQRLPGPALPTRWSYYIVHPSHRRLHPAAKRFADWLLEAAARDTTASEVSAVAANAHNARPRPPSRR
ncbi:MAG: LysR family transcriptional regulator [Lysobacteraceae bacterium]|nr:MAG: LysR family transcriptional regulator [Xanthomonadaceae bacterium]